MQSDKIRGILVNDKRELRASQYADDLILFLKPEDSCLRGAMKELQVFSSMSGLKVNVSNTKFMPVGKDIETINIDTLGMAPVKEMKILGVAFNGKNSDITDKNIEDKLPLITREITQWKGRHLSLLGKVTVIKSLLLTKLVYIFMA